MTNRNLTPHGRIIEAARGKVSAREAARVAQISEGRWRQIVTGVQKAGGGIVLPVNPRIETLISMASAVGADVATVLRAAGVDLIEADAAMTEASTPTSGITSYSNDDLLKEIRRRMTTEESESDGNTAPITGAEETSAREARDAADRKRAGSRGSGGERPGTLGGRPIRHGGKPHIDTRPGEHTEGGTTP